jgi:hypothetical protein
MYANVKWVWEEGWNIVASEGLSAANQAGMLAAGNQATIPGINYAFVIATLLSVAALLLACFIKNTNAQPRQQLVNSKKGQTVASSS